MAESGIEWEQLGTEKSHLSILDYKKQERQKEIAQANAEFLIKQNQLDSMENSLSYMQDKIGSAKSEVDSLRKQADELLNYLL